MEHATALIDVCKGNPHSYVVNFVVREPRSFTIGAKVSINVPYPNCFSLFPIGIDILLFWYLTS